MIIRRITAQFIPFSQLIWLWWPWFLFLMANVNCCNKRTDFVENVFYNCRFLFVTSISLIVLFHTFSLVWIYIVIHFLLIVCSFFNYNSMFDVFNLHLKNNFLCMCLFSLLFNCLFFFNNNSMFDVLNLHF